MSTTILSSPLSHPVVVSPSPTPSQNSDQSKSPSTSGHPVRRINRQSGGVQVSDSTTRRSDANPQPKSPHGPKSLSDLAMLRIAMADCDRFVVEFEYADSNGKRTRRTVSPIRFPSSDRFLGLCLCREQPRQFYLERCQDVRLIPSDEVIMPVPMVEIAS